MTAIKRAALCSLLTLPLIAQDVERIIQSAINSPDSQQAVGPLLRALNSSHDTRLISTVRVVFDKSSDKRIRQNIAVALIKEGDKAPVYFGELVRYASAAIDSTAPMPFEVDDEGKEIPGNITEGFKRWCHEHDTPLETCLTAFLDSGLDVVFLVSTHDPRAIPILRKGLAATNYAIVQACVKGLANLSDTDALPMIVQAISRFRPVPAQLIAIGLSDFHDPRIPGIIDQFVKDAGLRERLKDANLKRVH